MLAGVRDNETMNMGNDDSNVITAPWKDAQEIVDIYDDAVYDDNSQLVYGAVWDHFTAEQQDYIVRYMDNWLSTKKRAAVS
jgi:hypothetical protein